MRDIRSRLVDGFLCTCITVSLAEAIFAGFVLEDILSASVLLTILAAAVLTALLLLASSGRKATVAGIAVGVVLLAAAVVYVQSGHPINDETENSLLIAALVLFITAVLVWLLARTTAGTIALFLIGLLISAGSLFLEFPAPVWGSVLFLAAAALLFLYRRCTASVRRAAVGRVKPAGYTVQAAVVCLIALLLSGGLYYGIVRPLAPPTQELRLITQLKSMDLLQVLGVSTTRTVLDETLVSQEEPEDEKQGNEEGEEEDEDAMNAPEEAEEDPADATEPAEAEVSLDTQDYSAVRYNDSSISALWLLLLIPAAIVAAILLRIYLRRRRQRKLQALPPEAAAVQQYRFFLRCLKKAGIARPQSHTLAQYVQDNAGVLAAFTTSGADFVLLTEIYQAVLYGSQQISEEEGALFETFYAGFYPALRKEMGLPKYLLFWFSM